MNFQTLLQTTTIKSKQITLGFGHTMNLFPAIMRVTNIIFSIKKKMKEEVFHIILLQQLTVAVRKKSSHCCETPDKISES